ncbi:TonB-dependent receptor plug domain-containing protein [Paraglaciecola arctica]|uniref:TonB-dependent receptor plug domain-containing protein n=1 Tax=Paraglaciecola arctica TaxID=1128911 RepID=UPI001C077F82|nr:TonB-dependent receptor [Paraglaciecola arctica]MBU3005758.1 TonB-dependent receptor plug domain-containing protein [Paraglaciecola arctica]
MFFLKRFFVLLLSCSYLNWVTASEHSAQSVEVLTIYDQQSQLLNNYQILTAEDFVNSSQTLAQILQSINGIQIRQIGGLGNPISVSMRGSTSKQVQLFIDGQLVNDSQFGGFDLNQIPTEQIQSIEISKNQAIGAGSTPIGGVIRINTYNSSQDKLKLSLVLGSYAHQELNLLFNKAFDSNTLSVGGSYLKTDNNYDYLVPQSFSNSNQSTSEPLGNNQFEKHNFFINNQMTLANQQIRLSLQYNDQNKAIPNYQNNTLENASNLSSETWRLGYRHSVYIPTKWLENLEFEAYRENKSERYLDILADITRLDGQYDTTKSHAEFNTAFLFENQYGDFAVSPFIQFMQQQFDSLSFDRNGPIVCNAISSCDVMAKQDQQLLGSRFEWQQNDGGFSVYSLLTQLKEKNQNIAVNQANAEKFINKQDHQTQEVGLVYQGQKLKTQLVASNGIRTPTLFELFGDRGLFKGSQELLPEQAKTVSLGVTFEHTLAQMNYTLISSIYRQQSDNAIVAIFNTSGVGAYENVSNATLNGLELESKLAVTSDFNINMQANFIDSQTDSAISSFDNKKLPGIYHQQYSFSVNYQITPQWKIQLRSALDKDLYFNRANIFESNNGQAGKPAQRKVTDIQLSYLRGIYHFNFSVNNLFDQQYQDLANRPAQGRNILFKLSIQGI